MGWGECCICISLRSDIQRNAVSLPSGQRGETLKLDLLAEEWQGWGTSVGPAPEFVPGAGFPCQLFVGFRAVITVATIVCLFVTNTFQKL